MMQGYQSAFDAESSVNLEKLVLESLRTESLAFLRHPLGFAHCKLIDGGRSSASVRLHYWERAAMEKGSAITPFHDHVWQLTSGVIAGEIINNMIEITPDRQGKYTLETVQQDHKTGQDTVENEGHQVSFRVHSKRAYKSGDFYRIQPRRFHFSELGESERALSVVLSEPSVNGNPRTLMPIDSTPHAPVRQEIDDPDQLVTDIIELIQKGQ